MTRKRKKKTSSASADDSLPPGSQDESPTASAIAIATAETQQADHFPIVGVGASAGGLDALRQLLEAMPERPEFAIVIILHLARDKPSLAPSLLSKYTTMEVRQVHEETLVRPNCVYIISPGSYLGIQEGRLQLTEIEGGRTTPVAVDLFFKSLAKDQTRCAIGVILSGTGSDGTRGAKAIKEAGGFVIVQEPSTAEFAGMPESAIASGVVDRVLSPQEIPAAIARFAQHSYLQPSTPLAPQPNSPTKQVSSTKQDAPTPAISSDSLYAMISLLRDHDNHDFRNYKDATLVRRTRRRMCLHQIEDIETYLAYLKQNPDEITALAKDLLISVTDFFRDREAWDELSTNVIHKIVANKTDNLDTNDDAIIKDNAVRVWVPGCATGEEAYTVAMLILDELRTQHKRCTVQVFASDIDKAALQYARIGRYPRSIQSDVSAERLQRYFDSEEGDGPFRVNKTLRETVIFADQNLISDPPFSQLDLVCCRNVLIYLNPETQQKVIKLFHFVLRKSGYLMLGTAETVGRQQNRFETVKKKQRIFRRIGSIPDEGIPLQISTGSVRRNPPRLSSLPRRDQKVTHLIQHKLFDLVAPRAILIDRHWRILYINGDVNPFLLHTSGVPNDDLLSKLRRDLRSRLQEAVQRSFAKQQPVRLSCRLAQGTNSGELDIEVRPLHDDENEQTLALIIFREPTDNAAEQEPSASPPPSSSSVYPDEPVLGPFSAEAESTIRHLEDELSAVKDELQSSLEQFEISHEEYKASNEEVMSVNEELQSTNEELETSKEELQSLNEELATTNQLLGSKVEELERKHADLENLISATEIPTICLGIDLTIRWFTPAAQSLVRIRDTDKGRPLSELAHDFQDESLTAECERVLAELQPIENEVDCRDGRCFVRRVIPYRLNGDQVGGVVVTMIDITARKQREEQLRASEERFRRALSVDGIGILFYAADATLLDCNDWFLQRTSYSREDVQTRSLTSSRLTPPEWSKPMEALFETVRRSGHVGPYEMKCLCKDGSQFWMIQSGCTLEDGTIVMHCVDIGERKRVETELRQAEEKLRAASTAAKLGWYSYDVVSEEIYWSKELRSIVQVGPDEPLNLERLRQLIHPEDRAFIQSHLNKSLRECDEDGYHAEFRIVRSNGEIRWFENRGKVLAIDEEGKLQPRFAVGMLLDITERKAAEQSTRELNKTLEQQAIQRNELRELLQHITRIANEAKTVEMAMRVTLDQITQYNGWLVGHVWRLADDDSGQMQSTGLWHVRKDAALSLQKLGDFQQTRGGLRFASGQGMIGRVLQTNEPQWVEDATLDPLLNRISDVGFRAAIAFPITVDGEIVAVMEFLSDHVLSRNHFFLEILPHIGIQLGHLIARKRLEAIAANIAIAEQQRIGRELHDGIAQQLTGGALIAETLRRSLPEQMKSQFENVKHLSDILKQAHQDVRRLSNGLLPSPIESVDLLPTLHGLAADTVDRFHLKCDVDHHRFDEGFVCNDSVALVIYQIACEAVHNTIKHAQANQIVIELRSMDHFAMTVRDDGVGFTFTGPAHKTSAHGLRIMRYRAESIGGELKIDTAPNQGTSVTLTIPQRNCQS